MKYKTFYVLPALISITAGCSRQQSAAGPPLVVTPKEQTVITTRDQAKYKVEYSIRNTSYEPIQLQNTETTCGCTLANIEPRMLQPGQTAKLTADVDSIPVGSKNVQITVKTSSKNQPELVMNLKLVGTGKVPYVAYVSETIPFGRVFQPGQKESFFVETREAEGSKPWLGIPVVDSVDFTMSGGLKEERSMGAGTLFRRYEFQMEQNKLVKTGEFRGVVVFQDQSDPKLKIQTISYNGQVMPAVYATPSAIFGSFSRFNEIPEYIITFQHDPSLQDLQITHSKPGDESILVEAGEPVDSLISFHVKINKSFSGEFKSEVVFETNQRSLPEVRLPVLLKIIPDKADKVR